MSLRKMFPAGQLPDKFTHGRVREIPMTITNDDGMVFGSHERHVAALLRISKTMAQPTNATLFEIATMRAAMAAHGVCPDCGGHVHVDTTAEVVQQADETQRRDAAVAFCSGCEFALEMPDEGR